MYATLIQSDTLYPYGRAKTDTRPGGVGLCKKPKDLSASDRQDREHGEGRDVYVTLLQSDTVQSFGREKAGTRTVGVGLCKKPKDLSGSERQECEHVDGQPSSRSCRSVLFTD